MTERENLQNAIESDRQNVNRGMVWIGIGALCHIFDVKLKPETEDKLKEEYVNYLLSVGSLYLHETQLQQIPLQVTYPPEIEEQIRTRKGPIFIFHSRGHH